MEREQRRQTRYRRRRLRIGRLVFTSVLLIVCLLVIYSIQQFRAGQKLASETKIEQQAFTQDEPIGKMENYLILGVDSRGEEKSRTDTMMLLSLNKESKEMKLVSFMRDIYAEIPGYQSYKLNTAYYLGGVDLLKDTLHTMFDIPIHHYAIIDFKSFESLIDILSPAGIMIDVEKDMSENIGVQLKKGTYALNGQQLLGYARFRQDAEGDFGRVARQQKVMQALKEELLSIPNIKNMPKFAGALEGYVTTDLTSTEQLSKLLFIALNGGGELEKMTLPVEGTYSFNSYSHAGSVIEIDKEVNQKLLNDFLQMK